MSIRHAMTCPQCGGDGVFDVPRSFRDDPYYCDVIRCDDCQGVGLIPEEHEQLSMDETLALDQQKLDVLLRPSPTHKGEKT